MVGCDVFVVGCVAEFCPDCVMGVGCGGAAVVGVGEIPGWDVLCDGCPECPGDAVVGEAQVGDAGAVVVACEVELDFGVEGEVGAA